MGKSSLLFNKIRPRHAFFLGALLALLALAPAIIPYSGQYVTRGDYIEQQLPFILETRRILRGGLNSYSFSTFLGAPAVGSYAFYTLGSPFVWPLALLPQALIPYGISLMALLKHAVCALCAFCFFRRVIRSERLALLGSVLYTFSSFTIVNTQFYHFTEVIAFFPLILLGLEDAMSEHPRYGLLALFCGLNTLTNYYFMLGSALLAALYFAFRFFSEDWKPFRKLSNVVRVVFECGVGCALAGVLLVPSMLFMLSITRTGAGDIPLLAQHYAPSLLLERLRVLFMPIESNVLHAFYGDAPSWSSTACYLPVLGMTGVCVFALRGKRQNWMKALLAFLLLCSVVPALCGAFALFTNMSYTRWWYGFALLLTLATLYALRDNANDAAAWKFAFFACVILCVLLTLPFALPNKLLSVLPDRLSMLLQNRKTGNYAPDSFRLLSFVLAGLGALAMLFLITKRPHFHIALALVCAVACAQYAGYIAVGDALLLSGGETPAKGKYTLSQIAEPTLSTLTRPEETGYARIDYGPLLRNYGLMRGQSSLTCFSSLRSSTVGRFVSMAGFGYDESTTVRPPDMSAPIRAFLSVSEYHETDGEGAPEGFIYDHEENGFSVYRNPNALPMGFLQTICTGEHTQRMDETTVGTVMLAAVTLSNELLSRYEEKLERLDVYAIPDWQESVTRLAQNACDRFDVSASGFTAHIDAKQSGLLVFTIPFDKGFCAFVDGNSAEIVPCDTAFMSVWVDPGEHEIEFRYRTRGLTLGIAMSLVAAIILCAYVVFMKNHSH